MLRSGLFSFNSQERLRFVGQNLVASCQKSRLAFYTFQNITRQVSSYNNVLARVALQVELIIITPC